MYRIKFYLLFLFVPMFVLAQPNLNDPYLQKFTEVGVQAGIAGYAGDLGGALGSGRFKDFDAGLFRPMVNINATHRMSPWASFRPGLTLGKVAGDDNSLVSTAGGLGLRGRNLSFRTLIAELSVLADVNPLYIFKSYAEQEHNFYPYISLGLGAFYFSPQANLNGAWVDLRPLRLEGQGFPQYPQNKQYSKVQVSVPMGAGFKYYISSKYYIGAEGMVRKTFTDYLDDVSTRYIDPALFSTYLSARNASLSAQLYNRYDENSGGPRPGPNGQRGNPENDDYFYTISLRFGIVLNNKFY